MLKPLTALLLLIAIAALPPKSFGADDAVLRVSKLLDLSSSGAKQFKGTIDYYSAENADELPMQFDRPALKKELSSKCWVKGNNTLIESTGAAPMAAVGEGSKYNDILEVLAASKTSYFRYLPVGSMAGPFANLSIYNKTSGTTIEMRLQDKVYANLNAFHAVAGFPIKSALTSPSTEVKADPSQGRYSVVSTHNTPGSVAELSYTLDITADKATCRIRLLTGESQEKGMVVEALVEGTASDTLLTPTRILRRFSGEGYGPPRIEAVELTKNVEEEVPFPITKEFFKRYERDYAVLMGDSLTTSEQINATPSRFLTDPSQRFQLNAPRASSGWGMKLVLVAVAVALISVLYIAIRHRGQTQ